MPNDSSVLCFLAAILLGMDKEKFEKALTTLTATVDGKLFEYCITNTGYHWVTFNLCLLIDRDSLVSREDWLKSLDYIFCVLRGAHKF